jgi:hypothetical protein
LIQDRYFDGECILLKDAIEDSEQQTKLVQQMHFCTRPRPRATLIVDAYALTGLQPRQRRKDFTPEEMRPGGCATISRNPAQIAKEKKIEFLLHSDCFQ